MADLRSRLTLSFHRLAFVPGLPLAFFLGEERQRVLESATANRWYLGVESVRSS